MKKISFLIILTLIMHFSDAQNVNINYASWNPFFPPCNLFAVQTAVPAIVGGSNTTLPHRTNFGQPKLSTIGSYVQLPVAYDATLVAEKGSSFNISYNFKYGYKYIVTITASGTKETLGTDNSPYAQ